MPSGKGAMHFFEGTTKVEVIYIQLYYATGAAKDKKEDTINTKSNEKKNLQSTQIVNIHQENLGLTHTQETVNFGKS